MEDGDEWGDAMWWM